MPISISSDAIIEKNKLEGAGAWLVLMKFVYPGENTLYIVNNTELINWDGQDWKPMTFNLGEQTESKEGDLPKVKCTFTDPTRILINLLDSL